MTISELEEAALTGRLRALEASLEEIGRLRKWRTGIGLGGFVLIMLAVVLFLNNLRGYARDYNSAALTSALGSEAASLLASPEVGAALAAMQGTAMTQVNVALTQRVQAELPQFESEAQGAALSLGHYVENDLKQRLAKQLADSLGQIYAALLQDYGHLPQAQIQHAVDAAKEEYVKQLTATLERRVQTASGSLHGLQQSFDTLAQDKSYAALASQPPEQIATNLYAGILESALYNLQPERGGAPVAAAAVAPTASAAAAPNRKAKPGKRRRD